MGAALMPIAIGGSILGTGLSAYGSIREGLAAKDAADYQAQVARNNAVAAEQEAQAVEEAGEIESRRREIVTAQRRGAQRTGAASRGVIVDQDTALDLIEEETAIGALDSLTIRNNAARDALRLRTQSQNFLSEADLLKKKGREERTAGFISAAGTVLSGGGRVASKWKEFE